MAVFFSEKPYIFGVSVNFWNGKACFGCGETNKKLLKCKRCQSSWYCDVECQKYDWTTGQHKEECSVFRRCGSEEKLGRLVQNLMLRLATRLIARKGNDCGKPNGDRSTYLEHFPANLATRNVSELNTCEAELSDNTPISDEVLARFKSTWKDFQDIYKKTSSYFENVDYPEFRKAVGSVWRNAFPIIKHTVYESEYIGTGMFLEASQFSHSCVNSDLRSVCEGARLLITSRDPDLIASFQKGEMSEEKLRSLTLTRFSVAEPKMESTKERQAMLMNSFLIDCNCEECQNNTKDDIKLYSVHRKCNSCKKKPPMIVRTNASIAIAQCPDCGDLEKMPLEEFKKTKIISLAVKKFLSERVMNLRQDEEAFPYWQEASFAVLNQDLNILYIHLEECIFRYMISPEVLNQEEEATVPLTLHFGESLLRKYLLAGIEGPKLPQFYAALAKLYESCDFQKAVHNYVEAAKEWKKIYENHPVIVEVKKKIQAVRDMEEEFQGLDIEEDTNEPKQTVIENGTTQEAGDNIDAENTKFEREIEAMIQKEMTGFERLKNAKSKEEEDAILAELKELGSEIQIGEDGDRVLVVGDEEEDELD